MWYRVKVRGIYSGIRNRIYLLLKLLPVKCYMQANQDCPEFTPASPLNLLVYHFQSNSHVKKTLKEVSLWIVLV